ncbi:hypothetical protein V2J09_013283 [Rumex salicifolius]
MAKRLQDFSHHVRLATHLNFKDFVKTAGVEFYPLRGDPQVHQVKPDVLLGLSVVGDATVMHVFVYTIFGSSQQLAVGPVALISLLVAKCELAILLALMVGALQGPLKGGWENDETVEQAAVREALEEARVRGDLMASLGEYDFKSKTLQGKSCPQGQCKVIVK